MPAVRTKRKTPARSAKASRNPEPLDKPNLEVTPSGSSDDEAYSTAHEEENYTRLLNELVASDRRKKEAARTRRLDAFQQDVKTITSNVQSMIPPAYSTALSRTNAAVTNLLAGLKRRGELEKTYLDAACEMQLEYEIFNRALTKTLKERIEKLQSLKIAETQA